MTLRRKVILLWHAREAFCGRSARARRLEHDPEKWKPVFGKDHAQTKSWSGMMIRRKIIPL
jgi:hypothetical protein